MKTNHLTSLISPINLFSWLLQHASAADTIELSESSGHVYTNPNYPTLEIGGMPFYLMPASPVPRPGLAANSKSDLAANSNNFSNHPGDQSNSKSSSQSTTGFYEPSGGSTLSQRSGGPIYEDIDRMCTYRGSPPNDHSFGGRIQKEERTYYNVPPHSQQPRSDSGEGDSSRDAAHNFCGTRY